MASGRPWDPFAPHDPGTGNDTPAQPDSPDDGLDDKTVPDLKKLAKKEGVHVTRDGEALNKAELIDAIRQHRGDIGGQGAPPWSPDPSVGTGGDAQQDQGEPAGTDEHGGPAVDEDTVNDWSDDESASLGD